MLPASMLPSLDWALVLGCIVVFGFGYLLGSIPFGVILTRFAGAGDIRAIGSGNIGATNVLRTGRKGLAALTLVCDALKGTAAVRSEEHTSELQSLAYLVCRLLLGKKKKKSNH